jgi:DNA-directed RNA polymerase specialized sigma24 family protein
MMIADMGFTTTTPSRTARVNEASGILLEALDRLPPDYREVVRKYDLEGVAIGEIAAAMNRSAGALHMLRGRAHQRLREILGESRDFLESRA